MTDRWLEFNSLLPSVWIVITASVFAVVFVWLEWKKNSRFRLLRAFAQVTTVASVALLILRPAIREEYRGEQTIVLTANFDRRQVDSLQSLFPKAQLKRTAAASNYRDAQLVDELNEISGAIYIIGDGFTPGELDEIAEKQFTYVPSSSPKGIISIIPEQQPHVNQLTDIHIRVTRNTSGKVLIKGPGKIEDSVAISAENSIATLRIRPKQAGQFLYSIIVKDQNGSVIEEQPLALDILPEQKLRIVILQEYPTSEVRYLKNFLADRGHAITLRYQLSRNIYRHEFANSEQKKINRVDRETLSAFDVAVIDSDVLKKLSAAERKQLSTSLREGLGLLVLFNESPQQNRSADDVPGISFTATKSDTAYLPIMPGTTTRVRTLGATAKSEESLVPLLLTSDKKILSGFRYHGIGKSGFNLVTETYRFLIEGNENIYAAIWSPLLTQLARKKQEAFSINVLTSQPIYVNEPVTIEILSAFATPSPVADSITIPLTEDVLIDDRWIGKTWFAEPGWHTITVPEDSTKVSVYVYKRDELKSVRMNNQQKMNSLRQALTTSAPGDTTIAYEPIHSGWFFFTFLVAAGFLWLAPKL